VWLKTGVRYRPRRPTSLPTWARYAIAGISLVILGRFSAASMKLRGLKIGIIGLDGTGSYILDLVDSA